MITGYVSFYFEIHELEVDEASGVTVDGPETLGIPSVRQREVGWNKTTRGRWQITSTPWNINNLPVAIIDIMVTVETSISIKTYALLSFYWAHIFLLGQNMLWQCTLLFPPPQPYPLPKKIEPSPVKKTQVQWSVRWRIYTFALHTYMLC